MIRKLSEVQLEEGFKNWVVGKYKITLQLPAQMKSCFPVVSAIA